MSKSIGPNSLHRIATYNKGCRCEMCKAAASEHSKRYRSAETKLRLKPNERDQCTFCGAWYSIIGLKRHEWNCR